MNPDASFGEKIEKGVHYRHLKAVGPKPNTCKFGPFRVPFSTPNMPNWPLDFKHSFAFGCSLDSSSRVFWQVLVPRRVSSSIYDFSSLFWIIRLFKNNYLVDKCLKINLDKVQIIHNFIVIQSSFLFLCMQSYFKH